MRYCVGLLGALLALQFAWTMRTNDKQGPYRIVLRGVDDCSPEGDPNVLIKYYLKYKRVSRSKVLIGGGFSLNIKLDDNIKCKMIADQLSSQGWKENYFTSDAGGKGICTIFDDIFPGHAKQFFEATKGPNATCVTEPGNYTVDFFEVDFTAAKGVPIFFYNKYKVHFHLSYPSGGPQIGCLNFYVDIVPATKKG